MRVKQIPATGPIVPSAQIAERTRGPFPTSHHIFAADAELAKVTGTAGVLVEASLFTSLAWERPRENPKCKKLQRAWSVAVAKRERLYYLVGDIRPRRRKHDILEDNEI